ncbi:DUF4236 domain-containing protein [Clostridium felsineum]|uniref:Uncharacterized protein n=1 Tax=Clostridium felsineum TaxID=36839 RepID=A0A1S8L541_9CLOT|nr:DUF4236 domain-containing protein [Clostridium felsineum]URZ06781.1 hypothetical protein CLROS_021140 [Clostridium felsineum]URZ11813.1 hypothetical protein CROST_025300 [Clostridium felsineum]
MFIKKSVKLGKHARINVTKKGLSSITFGGKHSRFGIRKDGSTYASANKNGVYVRQELSKGTKGKQLNKVVNKNSNNELTLGKLLKICLALYIIVLIMDGLTLKSGLLLKVVGALDIIFFIITGIGIISNNKKDKNLE